MSRNYMEGSHIISRIRVLSDGREERFNLEHRFKTLIGNPPVCLDCEVGREIIVTPKKIEGASFFAGPSPERRAHIP